MRGLVSIGLLFAGSLFAQSYGLTMGGAKLESASALAFGPDGILFVGDSAAGSIYALDTEDRAPQSSAPDATVAHLDQKIAALLGTAPSQIQVHDVKVNPISKRIYLAVSRGRGPDAIPVLLRVDSKGEISELTTEHIAFSKVALPGIPDLQLARGRNSRLLAITDLQFANGQLMVAGLSNEDFSSTLRVVPFPFKAADRGASVEIYHTSHFTYETQAPVRTMVPYTRGNETFLLAAYTCTPLVRLRVNDLKDGVKLTGETLAELGRHSSPLDMILYRSEGSDHLLVANTNRGVLKLTLNNWDDYTPVDEATGDARQIPMQRISYLKNVVQLDTYDETHAVMLFRLPDRMDLEIFPLP